MAKFPYHVTFDGVIYPPNTEVPVNGEEKKETVKAEKEEKVEKPSKKASKKKVEE